MGTAHNPYLHTSSSSSSSSSLFLFFFCMKSKTSLYLAEVQETMPADAEESEVKNFHTDKYNAVKFIT
jgi:hypothetical protein